MHYTEQPIEERLRRDAFKRVTDYTHPQITLEHQPINARQCQELQTELRELVLEKVERVRRQYEALDCNKQYEVAYSEFVRMTGSNEAQQQALCKEIGQMHQVADVLLHPPEFGSDLYLVSDKRPSPAQSQEFEALYKYYEGLHKSGYSRQQNQAQEAIRRARNYVLRDRS